MTTPSYLPPIFASALALTLAVSACSSASPAPGAMGVAGMTATAGMANVAGSTANAGTAGMNTVVPGGGNGNGGMSMGGMTATAGTAGAVAVAGGGGASGGVGAGGSAGAGSGGAKATLGCGMNPPDTDSAAAWVKHDVEVTGVDPAFITMYPPNAGTTYSWTHRNYFLRLPTNYDSSKAYPVTIGTSGCGGPETVGSEGGYSPLGIKAGETEAIQVALSYVLSSAANSDCGGAVFADKFPNSPEPPYLAAVVKDIQAKYCTDSRKVFLGGYSSGAFESIQLGCANSDILRGYGVQIGGGLRVNGPMPCKGPVAAMFVVGLDDNENAIGPLDPPVHDSTGTAPARDEVLKRNKCTDNTTAPWDAAYPACVKYTTCPPEYPVVWCPVPGAGHGSPTTGAAATYVAAGLWKFWSTL